MLFSLIASLIAAAFLVQAAVLATTIYLHRAASHRAVLLHPVAAWVLRFVLWATTGILPREWVAVHRKHHAFTDQEGDPHSPLLEGFWKVQLGNVFYYVKEARNPETVEKYARDMKDDVWDRLLFNRGWLGPVAAVLVLSAILGVKWALLAAALHGLLYVFVLSSSINGLCHYTGYKNFDNTARNIRWLALLTGGEGLHNNHHGYPRSPKFSFRRSELDPAWPIIKLLALVKLAQPYKTIEQSQSRTV